MCREPSAYELYQALLGIGTSYVAAHPWRRTLVRLTPTDLGFALCKLHVLMISSSGK
jgi:hypothetical protein